MPEIIYLDMRYVTFTKMSKAHSHRALYLAQYTPHLAI